MHIQINTDGNIDGTEALAAHVEGVVEDALGRFVDRISRIGVHLSDRSGDKSGGDDKRCMLEARLEGRQPTAVTHEAATLDDAVDGAARKSSSSVETALERQEDFRRA